LNIARMLDDNNEKESDADLIEREANMNMKMDY